MMIDGCCVVEEIQRRLVKVIVDGVVAGRSQWSPVALKRICQVNGVKKLSERVAKARRRDNVGMF